MSALVLSTAQLVAARPALLSRRRSVLRCSGGEKLDLDRVQNIESEINRQVRGDTRPRKWSGWKPPTGCPLTLRLSPPPLERSVSKSLPSVKPSRGSASPLRPSNRRRHSVRSRPVNTQDGPAC